MNRTIAEYRAARATELAIEGMHYDDIARELGFADRSGAWRAVRRCLQRRQISAAERYVATTMSDLELVHERAWARAMSGDLKASEVVLRAMEDRLRLVEFLNAGSVNQGSQRGESERRETRSERGRDQSPFVDLVL